MPLMILESLILEFDRDSIPIFFIDMKHKRHALFIGICTGSIGVIKFYNSYHLLVVGLTLTILMQID